MILRERQRTFVSNCVNALKKNRNTLGVAPTGAGKTVCMAAVAGELRKNLDKPILVIQHRDELVAQNSRAFIKYLGSSTCSPRKIDANSKSFDRSRNGVHFAMIQTLSRNETLLKMPPMGAVLIDEAHHACADTYMRVIHRAKELNPDVLLYGTTATPNRGDKRGLRGVFSNCGDQISIRELISTGHLVRPRCYVIDVGTQKDLGGVPKTANDFDMSKVAEIMNKQAINDEVVKHWKERAADRQTIIFCSTKDHAKNVADTFSAAGVATGYVDSDLSDKERRDTLKKYDKKEYQVLVNVAVLTEGFDHQPTSCVILLRPSSWKSTMTQMIGRGLRKVDPELYPGVKKDDCIVLDFGTSLLTHGDIMDEPDLIAGGIKECPECGAEQPEQSRECPICYYEFPQTGSESGGGGEEGKARKRSGKDDMGEVRLTEIDILNDSPFKYEQFFNGKARMCSGFKAWACVISHRDGRFYSVGGVKEDNGVTVCKMLSNSSEYVLALQSADDWMREHERGDASKKAKRWMTQMASDKQFNLLSRLLKRPITTGEKMSMNKYQVSCVINWKLNFDLISDRMASVEREASHA